MSQPKSNILIIDDDVDMCTLLGKFLTKHGFEVQAAHTGTTAIEKIKKEYFNIIFSDFRLGDTDGRELLIEIKKISSDSAVIIITGYSDVKMAVEVIKLGAVDYVTKPLIPEEILMLVNKINNSKINLNASPAIETKPKTETSPTGLKPNSLYIVGRTAVANEIYRQIKLVAPTNFCIIIQGESGTGKESVAKLIQENSLRCDEPFISIDCGTLTKELAGSELFGHEKGAFTGAIQTKKGCFELANKGTLFLDEVGNLPYDVQVALLRVVQEKKIRRIGGVTEIPVDVRIIVASNENLINAVKQGRFREDLYHRFNEFSMHVPSLRERHDDIILFANYFLKQANSELNKTIEGFDKESTEIITNYKWPGNLRELKNVIKRSVLLNEDKLITARSLPQELVFQNKLMVTNAKFEQENTSEQEKPALGNPPANLKSAASIAEYELIMDVLKKVKYNKSKAAEILNIDRKTLYNKMKNLNI